MCEKTNRAVPCEGPRFCWEEGCPRCEAELERMEENCEDDYWAPCTVCGDNLVNAGSGYDTCAACTARA